MVARLPWSDPRGTPATLSALLAAGHVFCPTDLFAAASAGRVELVVWAREHTRAAGGGAGGARFCSRPSETRGTWPPSSASPATSTRPASRATPPRPIRGSLAEACELLRMCPTQDPDDAAVGLRWLGPEGGGLRRYYLAAPKPRHRRPDARVYAALGALHALLAAAPRARL